jgi:hypothetical protein
MLSTMVQSPLTVEQILRHAVDVDGDGRHGRDARSLSKDHLLVNWATKRHVLRR